MQVFRLFVSIWVNVACDLLHLMYMFVLTTTSVKHDSSNMPQKKEAAVTIDGCGSSSGSYTSTSMSTPLLAVSHAK